VTSDPTWPFLRPPTPRFVGTGITPAASYRCSCEKSANVARYLIADIGEAAAQIQGLRTDARRFVRVRTTEMPSFSSQVVYANILNLKDLSRFVS
jgi:hypothetical protein